ncbi:MAG TPA: molybdate ABC transporter substrate-binding protein [Candidatus Limnocylindrales bacterium]
MKPAGVALVALIAIVACTAPGRKTTPPASDRTATTAIELTVFAAASLTDAIEAANSAYEGAVPGTTLTISTDSSSALETQIEQGAPADVFLSADTTNPQKLVDAGLTAGDAVAFAANKLTIVVPMGNPGRVATPADLARPGLRIIAAGEEVPITKYAAQLVANLSGEDGYPDGFEAAYAANVVSREDNVKAVVAKIELGEGDAGIVYATDAAASDAVETVDVPDHANVLASYAGVVIATSGNLDAGGTFLDWIAGTYGQAVLGRFGFLPPTT